MYVVCSICCYFGTYAVWFTRVGPLLSSVPFVVCCLQDAYESDPSKMGMSVPTSEEAKQVRAVLTRAAAGTEDTRAGACFSFYGASVLTSI